MKVETLNNGGVLLSPPHNNGTLHPSQQQQQRVRTPGSGDSNLQITQPLSAPSSPLASPSAISSSTSFCLPSGSGCYGAANSDAICVNSNGSPNATDTADPNWQATKSTVLERNAAMFNNELMSDIKFVVGSEVGEYYKIR